MVRAARPGVGGRGALHTLPSSRALGASRPQALERIDDEGQRLEVDDDAFDGVGGGDLVDGGDREDRFAGIEGLVRQRLLAAG